MNLFGRGAGRLVLCLTAILLGGCGTPDPVRYNPLGVQDPVDQYKIRPGDELTVSFPDVPSLQPVQDLVKEDGTIGLIYNQTFQAAGKTVPELQTNIHDRYVPRYFQFLTPTIKMGQRFYVVSGEVRTPGRQDYPGTRIRVLDAIATAGGPTEFASSTVVVTRLNGKQYKMNRIKALTDPKQDLAVLPGDQIDVKKRFW